MDVHIKETTNCVVGFAVVDLRLNRHDPEEPLVDGSMSFGSRIRVTEHMMEMVRMFGEMVRRRVHTGEFCSSTSVRWRIVCASASGA